MLVTKSRQVESLFLGDIVPKEISDEINKDLFVFHGAVYERIFNKDNELIKISILSSEQTFIILEFSAQDCQSEQERDKVYYAKNIQSFDSRFKEASDFNHDILILLSKGIINSCIVITTSDDSSIVPLTARSGPGVPPPPPKCPPYKKALGLC